eukprot:SAG25_NODE_537_length_7103_cov_96.595231_7_plen_160_part_00
MIGQWCELSLRCVFCAPSSCCSAAWISGWNSVSPRHCSHPSYTTAAVSAVACEPVLALGGSTHGCATTKPTADAPAGNASSVARTRRVSPPSWPAKALKSAIHCGPDQGNSARGVQGQLSGSSCLRQAEHATARVWGEIMGSPKRRNVGKSQSVLTAVS